jgi:hypothetical protein
LEAEPQEDRRRVLGHGALGDHELSADRGGGDSEMKNP